MKDDRLISLNAAIDALDRLEYTPGEWATNGLTMCKDAIKALPSATDTNVGGNLIDRQVAIDALNDEYHGMISDESMKIYQIIKWLDELPSAQPTLYGYDIKHLTFVASIMAKKGVSPEEAVTIFRDVNRVIEMMLEDIKEMQENALKQTLKKPWEGVQDEQNRTDEK